MYQVKIKDNKRPIYLLLGINLSFEIINEKVFLFPASPRS